MNTPTEDTTSDDNPILIVKEFGVPVGLHRKPIDDFIVSSAGFTPSGDNSGLGFAFIYLKSAVYGEVRDICFVHPSAQDLALDNILGYFQVAGDMDPAEVIRLTEAQLRSSDTTEFMPSSIVWYPLTDDSSQLTGQFLIRAPI